MMKLINYNEEPKRKGVTKALSKPCDSKTGMLSQSNITLKKKLKHNNGLIPSRREGNVANKQNSIVTCKGINLGVYLDSSCITFNG